MNPIPDLRRRLEELREGDTLTFTRDEVLTLVEMADENAQRGRAERARRRRGIKVDLQIEDALRDQLQRVYATIYTLKRDIGNSKSIKDWMLGRIDASRTTLDTLRENITRATWK